VANRRGLAQAFEAESARASRGQPATGVALIDIDNFKKLNDSLGHAAGDVALKSLAARCVSGCGRWTTWRASVARSLSCCCPARVSTKPSRP
jgi:diguanylate cyclase (GGDEF)-like protein